MLAFNDFFSHGEGQQEFIETLKFVAGKASPSSDSVQECEVIHVAQLAEAAQAKATKL